MAKATNEILYAELETGDLFVQVKADPVTLVPKTTNRPFGQSRRPRPQTLATKYRRVY